MALKDTAFQRAFNEHLYHELNLERYELAKTGSNLFNHPERTNNGRYFALALAVIAAE